MPGSDLDSTPHFSAMCLLSSFVNWDDQCLSFLKLWWQIAGGLKQHHLFIYCTILEVRTLNGSHKAKLRVLGLLPKAGLKGEFSCLFQPIAAATFLGSWPLSPSLQPAMDSWIFPTWYHSDRDSLPPSSTVKDPCVTWAHPGHPGPSYLQGSWWASNLSATSMPHLPRNLP